MTTREYMESVGSKTDNRTIQLVPVLVNEFLNATKIHKGKSHAWNFLASYLNDEFVKDFERYLEFRKIKLPDEETDGDTTEAGTTPIQECSPEQPDIKGQNIQ